ncbi:MAG: MFS transporter, partial [Chloroflexi bacterium]|nr:MFS transporter [Chloroflexota bacterium]
MPHNRLRAWFGQFPRQFWVLFFGSIINAIGSGLVYPFFALYLRQRLGISMSTIGMVMAIHALAAFPGQLTGGLLADRLGRRVMMVVSLAGVGLISVG